MNGEVLMYHGKRNSRLALPLSLVAAYSTLPLAVLAVPPRLGEQAARAVTAPQDPQEVKKALEQLSPQDRQQAEKALGQLSSHDR